MKSIRFYDLQTRSIFDSDYRNLKWMVYKQLAFGRYTIEDGVCKVHVISDEIGCLEVIIDKTTRNKDFVDDLEKNNMDLVNRESAVNHFLNSLKKDYRDNNKYEVDEEIHILVISLEKYKKEHTIKGSDLELIYFFKLYSPRKELLNNDMREYYGAGYIDYEKQICVQGASPIIHNDDGLNGIWASSKNSIINSIYYGERGLFGNSLFILKPLQDCEYFLFPLNPDGDFSSVKEIIGDRFQVMMKMELPAEPEKCEQVIDIELKKSISM